jgi:hypothetical protein
VQQERSPAAPHVAASPRQLGVTAHPPETQDGVGQAHATRALQVVPHVLGEVRSVSHPSFASSQFAYGGWHALIVHEPPTHAAVPCAEEQATLSSQVVPHVATSPRFVSQSDATLSQFREEPAHVTHAPSTHDSVPAVHVRPASMDRRSGPHVAVSMPRQIPSPPFAPAQAATIWRHCPAPWPGVVSQRVPSAQFATAFQTLPSQTSGRLLACARHAPAPASVQASP